MSEVTEGSILISSESNGPVTSDNGTILCDPCGEEGSNIPANGYCVDCGEYLCDTCYSHHCTPRLYRHHVLQDATTMPRSRSAGRSSSNVASFKCHLHPMKDISAYCKSHDILCCESCVQISHRICKDVSSVQSLAADIFNSEEFKKFTKKLVRVDEKYGTNKTRANTHLKMTGEYYQNAMDKFKRKLDNIKSKDVNTMTNIVDTCDTVQKQLNTWKSDKDKFQNSQRNDQMFVLMNLTGKQLDMTERNVEQLATENHIVGYSFIEEDHKTSLGQLVKIAYLVNEINVKHSSETKACKTIDIALLGNDLMLVSDCSNYTIKLINTSSNTIVSHTKLNSRPFEMTVTDNNQVYVVQPDNKKLLHLTSSAVDVSKTREIPVDGKCFTVKYHDQKLKIQCCETCKLLEADLNGKVLRTINRDISLEKSAEGETFLTNPGHSCLHPTTGSMIVSSYGKNSITEITNDGKVKLWVKSDKLQRPRGLVMDTDGSVLVCSEHGKQVFRVTGTGEIEDIVLPEPLEFALNALALDKTSRRLFVGGDHASVLVYQL